MDKLREEFEKWFLSEMGIDVSEMRNEDSSTSAEWPYDPGSEESGLVISVAFRAWHSSRANIVVELPDLERYYAGKAAHTRVYSAHAFRNDVEKNLRSIGLSIKGE